MNTEKHKEINDVNFFISRAVRVGIYYGVICTPLTYFVRLLLDDGQLSLTTIFIEEWYLFPAFFTFGVLNFTLSWCAKKYDWY